VPHPARRLVTTVAILAVTFLAVACGTTTPTGASIAPSLPAASSPIHASPLATSPPLESPSIAPPSPSQILQPSQSTVEWGRVWDAVPRGFPLPAGATESEIGAPAGGLFILTGDVPTTSAVMRGALEAAGFRTEGASGPLEDGSVVIDSTGSAPGCRVRTTIMRHGGLTTMTVLYGSSCPFE
jgi:hypothetical protein